MKTDKIEYSKYDGYYWMSDENSPHTLINEPYCNELDPKINPFIIEAQLYDKERKVSYSVKYVDGRYIAHRWDNVSKEMENGDNYVVKEFFTNRIGEDMNLDIPKMYFIQHWVEEPDMNGDIPEYMPVLQPKELIFVGF